MNRKWGVNMVLSALFLVFGAATLPERNTTHLLNDTQAVHLVQLALDKMYNYEFDEAIKIITPVEQKYPNQGVLPFFKSMCLNTQYSPIIGTHPQFVPYFNYLQTTLSLSETHLDKNPENPEALFFNLGTHGYLALLYSKERQFMKSMQEALAAYRQMKVAIKLKAHNPDFYFYSGLYYYYLDQYPQAHPMVKPLMMFFEQGNRMKGLFELSHATQHGIFTRTESKFFLSFVYLKYENQPAQSIPLLNELIEKYPKNISFRYKYWEVELNLGKFLDVEKDMAKWEKPQTPYDETVFATFQGWIEEKEHKNLPKAEKLYEKVIQLAPKTGRNTTELESYAYLGLGRIKLKQKDTPKANFYFQKCNEIAEYTGIKAELKKYLR